MSSADDIYCSMEHAGHKVVKVTVHATERVDSVMKMDGTLHGPIAEHPEVTATVEIMTSERDFSSLAESISSIPDGWVARALEVSEAGNRAYLNLRRVP